MEPTVADLDSCFRQIGRYSGGIPVPGTTDILNAKECYELLMLDPFYGIGQSAVLTGNPRFVYVGSTQYGMDPLGTGADLNYSMNQVITYASSNSNTDVASYTGTITDVIVSQDTAGSKLSFYGLSGEIGTESTETKTSDADWTVTLQSSLTATAQSSTTITGEFDDHNVLPSRPSVAVYRDLLFGSYAFQDHDAPKAP
jgi:hypothetical protein